jgi:hypothetical protein
MPRAGHIQHALKPIEATGVPRRVNFSNFSDDRFVPKAPIAGADINDCYLEAVIRI